MLATAVAASALVKAARRRESITPNVGVSARPRGVLGQAAAAHPALGLVAASHRRFSDADGPHLAAAVTLQAFLSVFPLLIVASAVVGFVHAGGDGFVDRAVEQFGLTGTAAATFTDAVDAAKDSRRTASVVGAVWLAWAALGFVSALQFGYNRIWGVQSRGIRGRVVGVAWLSGFAVLAVASGAITTVVAWLPGPATPLAVAAAVAVNFAAFLWTAKVLPNRDVGWRPLVPGAVFAAVGFEALKLFAALVVPRTIENSSQLYGSIGVVIAVLGFLTLLSKLVLYSAALNVTLHERRGGG